MAFDFLNKIKNGLLPSQPKNSTNTNFGLQDFYVTAIDKGFARDFHFRVTQIGDSKLSSNELIYIRAGNIPEREIESDTVSFRGFKYNVPTTASYPGSDSWNVEFLMDKNYTIYDLIEKWHRSHFNESSFIGREVPNFDTLIEIMAIDEQLNVVKKFKLYGCFPRKLGALKFNTSGNGAPISFELSLAYQYWTSETMAASAAESKGLIESFIGGLAKLAGIAQGGRNVIRSVRSIPGL